MKLERKTQAQFDKEFEAQKKIWDSDDADLKKATKTSYSKKKQPKRKSDIKRGRLIGRRKGSALRANVFRGF